MASRKYSSGKYRNSDKDRGMGGNRRYGDGIDFGRLSTKILLRGEEECRIWDLGEGRMRLSRRDLGKEFELVAVSNG